MAMDERRRAEIATALDAYARANPGVELPRNAARLLTVMFPTGGVCQRSLQDIAGEGFDRKRLPGTLRRLVGLGVLSRQPGSGVVPDTYHLHLPPVRP